MIILAVALTAALAVGGVAFAFFGAADTSARTSKRVAAVAKGTGRGAAKGGGDPVGASTEKRRRQVQETLKEIERKQEQTKAKVTLAALLDQADWNIEPRTFYMMTGGIGVGIAILFLVLGYAWYTALLAGFAVGFGFPRWFLGFTINRRKNAFTKEFANAIDVIVRGVKSGLPLNECLKIISNEAPEPVAPEFKAIVEGQKVGVPLEDALRRMYERMPIPEVNFFQIVLTIQQKTGGNLAETLMNLSNVLRDRKRLHGKIRALSSEAKASAMIIGALPVIVMILVYLTTPSYIELLFTERMGNVMLACCAIWMSIGIGVMKKMINFKY
ncbi:MAG: pilus assembly protein [Alphaproteobacteria bacterium]|nr:pilus assembly protein [Alphaproteobacteria bacterium]